MATGPPRSAVERLLDEAEQAERSGDWQRLRAVRSELQTLRSCEAASRGEAAGRTLLDGPSGGRGSGASVYPAGPSPPRPELAARYGTEAAPTPASEAGREPSRAHEPPGVQPAPSLHRAVNVLVIALLAALLNAVADSGEAAGYELAYYGESGDGARGIFLTRSRGADIKIATLPVEPTGCPRWSPDRKRVTFAHHDGVASHIYTFHLSSAELTRLTHEGFNTSPAWSPDGSRIAFASNRDLATDVYVMNADGSDVVQLTARPGAFDGYPAWSPDGREIAFASDRGLARGLYVMGADGSGDRRVTRVPAGAVSPAWSPDGTRIAFAVTELGDVTAIYVVQADGSRGQRVSRGLPATHYDSPVWAASGRDVVFGYAGGALIRASAAGGGFENLTSLSERRAFCALAVFK